MTFFAWGWARAFIGVWVLFACAMGLGAAAKDGEAGVGKRADVGAGEHSAVILGDSLGLGGFGKRLDQRLRESGYFKRVNTYMACGTVPLSWLQVDGYRTARTVCGFWSIEGEGKQAKSMQDTYGMTKGYRPTARPVPKVEDLLKQHRPQVLVVQLGTNLHGIFTDNKTVVPERHGPALKRYIEPFLERISEPNTPLRRVYWVCPTKSGRMSSEVQDFVFETVKQTAGEMATVIDSRELLKYPYTGLSADKEHFFGADMTKWADAVFDRIRGDLDEGGLPKALAGVAGKGGALTFKEGAKPPELIRLKVKLSGKSPVLDFNQMLPYQESAVIYRYEVLRVLEGRYSESQILVCHPAHIKLQAQPLNRYHPGSVYEMQLMDLDASRWSAIKMSDQSGRPELTRYIQLSDEKKFPSGDKDPSAKGGKP